MTIFDGGGFGLPEAVVACRQMGYRSGAVAVYHNGMFGRGTSDVRLHKIHCEGREMSLMECSYSVCSGLECNRDNDIGVSCGSSKFLLLPTVFHLVGIIMVKSIIHI